MNHLVDNMVLVVDGGVKQGYGGTKYCYSNIYRAVKDTENLRYFVFMFAKNL